jgi:hypothetical protein
VRSRCVQGQGLDTLMEHRTVTSLFIIAEMQVHPLSPPSCAPPPLPQCILCHPSPLTFYLGVGRGTEAGTPIWIG